MISSRISPKTSPRVLFRNCYQNSFRSFQSIISEISESVFCYFYQSSSQDFCSNFSRDLKGKGMGIFSRSFPHMLRDSFCNLYFDDFSPDFSGLLQKYLEAPSFLRFFLESLARFLWQIHFFLKFQYFVLELFSFLYRDVPYWTISGRDSEKNFGNNLGITSKNSFRNNAGHNYEKNL